MAQVYDYTDAIADLGYLKCLSGRAVKLLWVIIRHYNKIKGSYPHYETITKKTGLDSGQIPRALDELRAWHIIRRTKIYHTNKNGLSYYSNKYFLICPDSLLKVTPEMKAKVDRILERRERFRRRKFLRLRNESKIRR